MLTGRAACCSSLSGLDRTGNREVVLWAQKAVVGLKYRGVGEGLVTYQGVGQLFLTMSAWMRTMFMAKRDPVALPVFGSS